MAVYLDTLKFLNRFNLVVRMNFDTKHELCKINYDDQKLVTALESEDIEVIHELIKYTKNFRLISYYLLEYVSVDILNYKLILTLLPYVNIHTDNDYMLRVASENGHAKFVSMLLKRGANVHADNDYALCWASYNGFYRVVKLLLDFGADPNIDNGFPLRWACKKGHIRVVQMLINNKAQINQEALRLSCSKGHKKIVTLLLRYGATATHQMLKIASKYCHYGVMRILKKEIRKNVKI